MTKKILLRWRMVGWAFFLGAPLWAGVVDRPFTPAAFQGGFLGLDQAGQFTLTGELDWTPQVELGSVVYLRDLLGMSLAKNQLGSTFPMALLEQRIGFVLSPSLILEVGGGMQTWVNFGNTNPVLSSGIRVPLHQLALLKWVYLTYSHVFTATNEPNELRVGAGVSF